MTVKFRAVKWKHLRQYREVAQQARENDQSDGSEVIQFVLDMVSEWDLKDEETGEPMPLGQLDELSGVQVRMVQEAFNEAAGLTTVPKTKGGR